MTVTSTEVALVVTLVFLALGAEPKSKYTALGMLAFLVMVATLFMPAQQILLAVR